MRPGQTYMCSSQGQFPLTTSVHLRVFGLYTSWALSTFRKIAIGSATPPKRHGHRRHSQFWYGFSADTTKQVINNAEIIKHSAKPLNLNPLLNFNTFLTWIQLLSYLNQNGGFERSDSSYRKYPPLYIPQLLMMWNRLAVPWELARPLLLLWLSMV